MSPDRRPDDFNEAEKNAPNPVVEALAIWRAIWQATPVERWNRLNLWSTMRDAARAQRLLAETDERAFCRGALEEVGVEAKKRRDLTAELAADPELVARLDDLIEASAASETAPTLAELSAVWNLSALDEASAADVSDAPSVSSCDSESRDSSADFVSGANSDVLYGGAAVGRSFTDESGAIPKSAARPLSPGDVVVLSDDYEIKRVAGKGGQKAVYEVVSKRLGTRFAVKELLSELGGSEARRRDLEREVKIQARLQHQGIPKVFALTPDADPTSNGLPRFVETYVEGEPWSARPFDRAHFEENLDILLQVAKIMAYAHDRGVVHRDLKPENVMLGRYGELYVVDWGLAFDLNEEGPKTGAVGTQAYLPPEQALRLPVDKRADVFTLGGILYKILTGFAPYELAQRTQGNAVAGRKAQACDFAPLDPEAAKAELLKLAEEVFSESNDSQHLYELLAISEFYASKPDLDTCLSSTLGDFPYVNNSFLNVLNNNKHQNKRIENINVSKQLRLLNNIAQKAVDDSKLYSKLSDLLTSYNDSKELSLLLDIIQNINNRSSKIAIYDVLELQFQTQVATIAPSPQLLSILYQSLASNINIRYKDAGEFRDALLVYRQQMKILNQIEEIKRKLKFLKEKCYPPYTIGQQVRTIAFLNSFTLLGDVITLRDNTKDKICNDNNLNLIMLNLEIEARFLVISEAIHFTEFTIINTLIEDQEAAISQRFKINLDVKTKRNDYIKLTQLKETFQTALSKLNNPIDNNQNNILTVVSQILAFIGIILLFIIYFKM